MSEPINVEFVGGPMDGHQRWLEHGVNHAVFFQRELVSVTESGQVKVVAYSYQRREVNGIWVRLPSGSYPFDWRPVKA